MKHSSPQTAQIARAFNCTQGHDKQEGPSFSKLFVDVERKISGYPEGTQGTLGHVLQYSMHPNMVLGREIDRATQGERVNPDHIAGALVSAKRCLEGERKETISWDEAEEAAYFLVCYNVVRAVQERDPVNQEQGAAAQETLEAFGKTARQVRIIRSVCQKARQEEAFPR